MLTKFNRLNMMTSRRKQTRPTKSSATNINLSFTTDPLAVSFNPISVEAQLPELIKPTLESSPIHVPYSKQVEEKSESSKLLQPLSPTLFTSKLPPTSLMSSLWNSPAPLPPPSSMSLQFTCSARNSSLNTSFTANSSIESIHAINEKSKETQSSSSSSTAYNSDSIEGDSSWESKRLNREEIKLKPYAWKEGIELFHCPLCPVATIATRAQLTVHLQQHQTNQKRDDGKHVCCFCFSELSSNSSLERHLLTHTNHRPFVCDLCDKAFTTNGNLSRHRRTSHQPPGVTNNPLICSSPEIAQKLEIFSLKNTNSSENMIKEEKAVFSLPLSVDSSEADLCKNDILYDFFTPTPTVTLSSEEPRFQENSTSAWIEKTLNLITQSESIKPNSSLETEIDKISSTTMKRDFDVKLPKTHHLMLFRLQHHDWASRLYFKKCLKTCHKLPRIAKLRKRLIVQRRGLAKCLRRLHLKGGLIKLFTPKVSKKLVEKIAVAPNMNADADILDLSIPMKPMATPPTHFLPPPPPPLSMLHPSISMNAAAVLQFVALGWPEMLLNTPGSILHPPFLFPPDPLTLMQHFLIPQPLSNNAFSLASAYPSKATMANTDWQCPVEQPSSAPQFMSPKTKSTEVKCEEPSPESTQRKKNSYKDAPRLISCPINGCKQKFPWNSSLKRHILTHTPHKPFSCTRCCKSFSTKSNRERHMERVHRVSLKRQKQRHQFGLFDASPSPVDEQKTQKLKTKDIIEELRDEEIASMDNNDKQAEDISNTLLRSAGSPKVEPNPERFHTPQKLISVNETSFSWEQDDKQLTNKNIFSEETAHMISDLMSYGSPHAPF